METVSCRKWILDRDIVRSVAFVDFINSNTSDVIAVTETWLQPDDSDSFTASVTPPGYKCTHVPCLESRGGGVRFFIHEEIDFKVLPQPCFMTFECISVHLSKTLFFTLSIGLLMFPKPISLRISVPLLRALLCHVMKM